MIKFRGGYLPKIAGKPDGAIEEVACPAELSLSTFVRGVEYTPSVETGATVTAGQSLASAEIDGGSVHIPAPAAGTVEIKYHKDEPATITIKCSKDQPAGAHKALDNSADQAAIRKALAECGIWTAIWSSSTQAAPSLNASERPRVIVVNLALTEPFRPSADTVLKKLQGSVEKGMAVLPRLLDDGGSVEVVYCDESSEAVSILKGKASGNVKFHSTKPLYPAENPRVICKGLTTGEAAVSKDSIIWVMDLQTVAAIGACVSEGKPLTQRVIACGGPACKAPKHYLVTVGTHVSEVVKGDDGNLTVLLGGLFNGMPAGESHGSVGHLDDALFCLNTKGTPELLAFIIPGFNRRSFFPVYAGNLIGAEDSHISATIRGEHRPCVACSACEKVCPADIMPQAIHRFLFSNSIDDAEALGLNRCVDCGLCSYVCPSKLDLSVEFAEAKTLIRLEKEESARLAAESAKGSGEKAGK